jgi:hypothetical protein
MSEFLNNNSIETRISNLMKCLLNTENLRRKNQMSNKEVCMNKLKNMFL